MGLPVSVVATNLVIEDVEKRAMNNRQAWKLFVDDAFVILERSLVMNSLLI